MNRLLRDVRGPFYLALDDRAVKASNPIGDPDWQSFVAQMEEFAAGRQAAKCRQVAK